MIQLTKNNNNKGDYETRKRQRLFYRGAYKQYKR